MHKSTHTNTNMKYKVILSGFLSCNKALLKDQTIIDSVVNNKH